MYARTLSGALLIGVALGITSSVYGGDICQDPDLCEDPCPAADSCLTNEDCDLGEVCLPGCLPSACFCESGIWTCTEDCLGECSRDTREACQVSADVGPCDGVCPRYYHNASSGQCESFVYGCCEGNANNFLTLAACEAACAGVAVPIVPAASDVAAWLLTVVILSAGMSARRVRLRSASGGYSLSHSGCASGCCACGRLHGQAVLAHAARVAPDRAD